MARIVHDRWQARSSAPSALPYPSPVVRTPRAHTALLSLPSPICDTRISTCRESASSPHRSSPSALINCTEHAMFAKKKHSSRASQVRVHCFPVSTDAELAQRHLRPIHSIKHLSVECRSCIFQTVHCFQQLANFAERTPLFASEWKMLSKCPAILAHHRHFRHVNLSSSKKIAV